MARMLFIHGHLIIDDYRQYEDGALLVDENKIISVYPHSNKVPVIDVYTVNLDGRVVFPSFDYDYSNYYSIVDPLNKIVTDKKIFIGNTKAYSEDVEMEYTGIYDLFNNMTGFNHQKPGLVNLAFTKPDTYVYIDPLKMDKSVFKICLKLIKRDRLLIMNNKLYALSLFKEFNINYNDMLMMCGLNETRLFDKDKYKGTLLQGKDSTFYCFDEKMNKVFKYEGGKISV